MLAVLVTEVVTLGLRLPDDVMVRDAVPDCVVVPV